ncbi:hypothetical protein FJQ64_12620 [Lysinibacillus sp. BW-2-10]|nr:hypothetical protein FJQ64_12620 [Lysinibacillus sp. BW-2-10]
MMEVEHRVTESECKGRKACLPFYPALTGSNLSVPKALATGTRLPPQDLSKTIRVGGRSTARKSPIASTNNQWGWGKPPLIEVSIYVPN